MPATGRLIGTPASISDSEEPHTEAIEEEPLDSRMSDTTRIEYGKLLDRRDHRRERALGERAVADVAALDAAHAARLPDREGREVVVVPVVLFRLQAERVEAHLLLERAHRDDAQRLRLPAREQRRAVRARRHADFDRDVADLVLRAAVGALLLDGDALADDRLLELVEGELHGRAALLGGHELLLGGALGRGRGVLLEDRLLDGLGRVLALELVLDLGGLVERGAVRGADLRRAAPRRPAIGSNSFFSLPTFAARSRCSAQSFLISACAMSSASRISASGISLAPASTIRIASSVPATIRSRSEGVSASASRSGSRRVDDEVAVDLADPHRADGRRQRDVGDHQRVEAPFIARMSYGWTWSIESGIATSCVS